MLVFEMSLLRDFKWLDHSFQLQLKTGWNPSFVYSCFIKTIFLLHTDLRIPVLAYFDHKKVQLKPKFEIFSLFYNVLLFYCLPMKI